MIYFSHSYELPDILSKTNSMTIEITMGSHIKIEARNRLDIVEALIAFGAKPGIQTPNKMNAHNWALQFSRKEVADYLMDVMSAQGVPGAVSEEEREHLELYHHCFNDDDIDCNYGTNGAVLIFIPGPDDILAVRDAIVADSSRIDPQKYETFILHSQMLSSDQKRVFLPMKSGCRKVILSTNIAETSVTIDDVVFVIDSGKVKEKSFDSLMGISSLKSVWISQSSVKQRRGRAGRTRPGLCFHSLSRNRYQTLQKHQLPEILRIPIHELCLQTKLLVPNTLISIHVFLSAAMDPPFIASDRASVQLLKTIDALDSNEGLTQLGVRLLDPPVEPNFGKMILYSIVLKCVDPVLTILTALTYRDPLILQSVAAKHKSLKQIRKMCAKNESFSDHIMNLTDINHWSQIVDINQKVELCREFLLYNPLKVIEDIRGQLLAELQTVGSISRNTDEHNLNENSWPTVKAALTAGAYPKLIRFDEQTSQYCNRKERIRFHNSSQLGVEPNPRRTAGQLPTHLCIYEELLQMGRHSYAKCCTAISPITITLFWGRSETGLQMAHNQDLHSIGAYLEIDDWISFETNAQTIKIADFPKQLDQLFVRRIESLSAHNQTNSPSDEWVVKIVVRVLETEELKSGFTGSQELRLRPELRAKDNEFLPHFRHFLFVF